MAAQGTPTAKQDGTLMLTAAECAARTGLTPRALRLYEEQGLIAPRRSAGGWRQYGATELERLNAITLLKCAGLSLTQIAQVMGASTQGPTLAEMLSIQLRSWRTRRADAERGERIAQTALERLQGGGSLSLYDLCDLIRSLEMSETPLSSTSGENCELPKLEESLLERYAGLYQAGDWSVITIRREGARLVLEQPQRPGIELRPTSETDFEAVGIDLPVSFDRDPEGNVRSLRMRLKGGDMSATWIDVPAAQKIRERLAERIAQREPLPGSEAAVRKLVEGLISGEPDYATMHPALAYLARMQMPHLHATAAYLGPIQRIEYQGVGSQGWDVYDVHQERGTARVRIVLRADGTLTGALFMVKDGPPSLGP